MSDDAQVRNESLEDQRKVYDKMDAIDKNAVKVKHHGRVYYAESVHSELTFEEYVLIKKVMHAGWEKWGFGALGIQGPVTDTESVKVEGTLSKVGTFTRAYKYNSHLLKEFSDKNVVWQHVLDNYRKN